MRRRFLVILVAVVLAAFWSCPAGAFQPVEAEFADYGGTRVHYRDVGNGKPVLVFVHGWSCNMDFWRHQAEAFSDSHRILLVDLPGHGLSDKPRTDYTIPYFAGSVLKAMDSAGVDRAVLMGHSMGFPIVREAWRIAPERVTALVSVDGAMNRVPEDPEERAEWEKENEVFLQRFQGPGYEEHVRRFVGGMHSPETPEEVRAEVVSEMLHTPQYVGQSAMENFMDPAVWEKDAAKVPVLMVYADMPWLRDDFEKMMREPFPRMTFRKIRLFDVSCGIHDVTTTWIGAAIR